MAKDASTVGASSQALPVLWLGIAVIVFLALTFAAHTPRGRLNVIQWAAVLVYLIAAGRCFRTREQETVEPNGSRGLLAGLAPALVVGVLVWLPMLPFGFISEDFEHLIASRQPLVSSLINLTTRGQLGAFLRPAAFATIFIDYRVWGEWPAGYHMTNLVIHLLTGVGLYYLCRYAGAARTFAGTAALIYTVLPVHAEAVAWMGARFDQLAACFTVWSVAFYIRSRTGRFWKAYVASAACMAFAILSKESAFALPLLLIAAEWLLMRDRRFVPVATLGAVAAALFGYRWLILGGIGGYADTSGQPIALNLSLKTLEGLLIRAPSLTMLGYNWSQQALPGLTIAVALTAGLLLAAAWTCRPDRQGRAWIAFAFLWIVLAVTPAHSLVFIDASLMNARILHVGAVGAALFVAQLLAAPDFSRARRIMTGAVALLFAVGTLHNLGAWRWTSQLTSDVLAELKEMVPDPPAGTRYVIHDLPGVVRGVYFLRSGFGDAIRVTYGRDDLGGERAEAAGSHAEPTVHIRWKGETKPMLEHIAAPD